MAVTGCLALALAACGGGGNSHPAKRPSPSASASAEPASGPAAVAAITANWKTVFNGQVSIPRRLALVQDGSEVTAFVEAEAKTSFGAAATGSTATVSSVTITAPSTATVHYEVLLLGTPFLKNQVGTAVYLDSVWKVGIASFCGLATQAVTKTGPQAPAVCRA
jgi:glucose/arabinose dehydrogenase